MPKSSGSQPDSLKLSRADLRKVNKVATGPLLGAVDGDVPDALLNMPDDDAVPMTVKPLGSLVDVRERLKQLSDGAADEA